jgi:hypothetical protein
MDAWTETFASPRKRTTGTSEGWLAIAGSVSRGWLPFQSIYSSEQLRLSVLVTSPGREPEPKRPRANGEHAGA